MPDEPQNHVFQVGLPFKDLGAWEQFVTGLRWENRFTLSERPAQFIDAVIQYAREHKALKLPSETKLFRARVNDVSEPSKPFALEEMGAPPRGRSAHGRLNPKGIPYLYLASNELTAISEVRPWVGCKLTVAEFQLCKDCNFINFSMKCMSNVLDGDEFKNRETTWREFIAWMFSAPFDPRDDTWYIPTQYLAERIKGEGLDGIIYDSALHENGYNVALFDLSAASAVRCVRANVTHLHVEAKLGEIK